MRTSLWSTTLSELLRTYHPGFAQVQAELHQTAAALQTLRDLKGIDAPQKLDTEHHNMVRKLEAQDGEAFDLEYSRHMNMDHDKAIDLFEATSKSSDTDLAGFAKKTLPTLKEHKQMASKLPGQ